MRVGTGSRPGRLWCIGRSDCSEQPSLSSDYAAAFDEWADDTENRAWDAAVADGLPHG